MAKAKTQAYVVIKGGMQDHEDPKRLLAVGDITNLTDEQAANRVNKVRPKRDHEAEAKAGMKARNLEKQLKEALKERDEALALVAELQAQLEPPKGG